MSAFSHDIVEIADAIKAKLDDADLGLAHNYYGDTNIVPEFPATIVEPSGKIRDLQGRASTHLWAVTMEVAITVLYAKLEDQEIAVHDLDSLVESVEGAINGDITLGGLVIRGWCISVAPGIRKLGTNVFYRASRIIWQGLSQESF